MIKDLLEIIVAAILFTPISFGVVCIKFIKHRKEPKFIRTALSLSFRLSLALFGLTAVFGSIALIAWVIILIILFEVLTFAHDLHEINLESALIIGLPIGVVFLILFVYIYFTSDAKFK